MAHENTCCVPTVLTVACRTGSLAVPYALFGGAVRTFQCCYNGSPMMLKSLFRIPKEAFLQDVKSRAEP